MSQKYEQILRESVEKLQLGPDDIIIVKSLEAMSTFLEMTQSGIGFSKYSNPILLVPGGLEKASRQDLLEALSAVDQHIAARGEQTDRVSRIITDLHAPVSGRIQ